MDVKGPGAREVSQGGQQLVSQRHFVVSRSLCSQGFVHGTQQGESLQTGTTREQDALDVVDVRVLTELAPY